MPGKLVISLDFELMWGVRDHRSVAEYGDAVIGVRTALPMMLERFDAAGIRATWATVGLLFAGTRDEVIDHRPALQPSYTNRSLSPYAFIENGLGKDEASDPHHFGKSLVDRILDTEGQELACHTFSHYFCLEPGQTLDEFRADLEAARSIASVRGVDYKSIVFPRNQWTESHVAAAGEIGIETFRGDPPGIMYRSRPGEKNTLFVRGLRLADSIVPVAERNDRAAMDVIAGLTDVTASRFLRTSRRLAGLVGDLQMRRVLSEMTRAAIDGRTYHLWWHPHNFGRNIEANMARLDRIIAHFRSLHDKHGMESATMSDWGKGSIRPAASDVKQAG